MGLVCEAEHLRLSQRIALKILRPGGDERAEGPARFEREAKLCSKLKSPHVVRVFDVDCTSEGLWFMAMELLEGRDLAREIKARGRLEIPLALEIIRQVCVGLGEAHREGIVHRDLKPSNIFLTPGDATGIPVAKILDFGISKLLDDEVSLTQTQVGIGTPLYMSPEQIRSAKHVDERTDVWSIGVMLYEMLTGQTPFSGPTTTAVAASIVADPLPPLRSLREEIPEALGEVVRRALAKNVADRIPSVDALRAALAPHEHGTAPPVLTSLFEDETTVARARPALAAILSLRAANPSKASTLELPQSEVSPTNSPRTDAIWSGALAQPSNRKQAGRRFWVLVGAAAVTVLVCLVVFGVTRSGEPRSLGRADTSQPVVTPRSGPEIAPGQTSVAEAPHALSAMTSSAAPTSALAPVSPPTGAALRSTVRPAPQAPKTCAEREKIIMRGRLVCP